MFLPAIRKRTCWRATTLGLTLFCTAQLVPRHIRPFSFWPQQSQDTRQASTMSDRRPPQAPIKWNHTPELIKSRTEEQIRQNRQVYDQVAALQPEECNFGTVFNKIAEASNHFNKETSPLTFYTHVTTDDEVRKASIKAEEDLDKYGVEVEMRVDVFRSLLHAEKNTDKRSLTPEQQRLVEKMVLEGKRAGLDLPEDKREKLKKLKEELAKRCQDFSNNCNQEKGYIDFTQVELKGVPQSAINGYKKLEDGKYRVTFKTPDSIPLLQYAENPETRRTMYAGMEDRLKVNVPVLDDILRLRRESAALLGYETWASYVLEDRMIKSASAAKTFLDDLREKLVPIGKKDLETLLALKKKEHAELNLDFDGQFYVWDWRYYDRKLVETSLSLDNDFVKEHFPVEAIVKAIMDIYTEMFSVRVEEVQNATVWHPDVKQFAVWDASSQVQGGESDGFLGYLHLDLYPRENKYGHAAVWGLIPGFDADGKRNYPVTCMVANLAKPTPDRPGLMTHDDVVTFFHEMGHAWHGLLSRTQYGRFHGTNVARDFVEAPSQMLENWCFEKTVLERISRHYQTQQPLPAETIDSIIKSRYVNVGLFYLRQVYIGMFDQALHTATGPVDANKKWNEMREQISLVKGFPENEYRPGYGSVGHLAGGYDAQYYGYAYSLVFAYDMYSTIFKPSPLDPAAGTRYRKSILQPGGSREEKISLEEFLGREPNSEAFARALFSSQKD